jgi:hypothetical protein
MTNIISSSIPSHQTKDESTSQVSPLLQAPIPCFSIKSVSPCFKLSQHHIIAMQCLSSRRYNKISASHTPPIPWCCLASYVLRQGIPFPKQVTSYSDSAYFISDVLERILQLDLKKQTRQPNILKRPTKRDSHNPLQWQTELRRGAWCYEGLISVFRCNDTFIVKQDH